MGPRAQLVRTFDSASKKRFDLDASGEWRAFGRDDVGIADAYISRKHLELCARRTERGGVELLARHTGSNRSSFVRRSRRGARAAAGGEAGAAAEPEWWLVPRLGDEPRDHMRLEHDDSLFVGGQLAPSCARQVAGPLAEPPRSPVHEFIVQLVPPHAHGSRGAQAGEGARGAVVDTQAAGDEIGGGGGRTDLVEAGGAGVLADAPLDERLAAVLGGLETLPVLPGTSVRESGLLAIDRACELAVELAARVAALRAREAERQTELGAALDAMARASDELLRSEAELFLDVAPIFAAKVRKLSLIHI